MVRLHIVHAANPPPSLAAQLPLPSVAHIDLSLLSSICVHRFRQITFPTSLTRRTLLMQLLLALRLGREEEEEEEEGAAVCQILAAHKACIA